MSRKHKHRKHKHFNNNQHQCDDDCHFNKVEEITISTEEEMKELLDLILKHGEEREQRYKENQERLAAALLAEAGVELPQNLESLTTDNTEI